MPFTFLSCDDFLRNNLKNYLYTSTQVRLMYHVLDMRAIGPPTSSSNAYISYQMGFLFLKIAKKSSKSAQKYSKSAQLY